jgi:cysteinyl-tRNA synthetase
VELVSRLEQQGRAYRTADGSVYFSMEGLQDYGKLSGMKLEELRAGARIEPGEEKRNPMDFALWKGAKPGEIAWDSPWGKGRPGWHIECSAMCMGMFGETIDIHGGGNDLIFPHHENEILQSESASGKPLAKYWLHNGMLNVQDAKMAKSLKNFFTVRQVLQKHTPEEVRFYLLNTHYRGPLVYSEEALDESSVTLHRLHNTYAELRFAADNELGSEGVGESVDLAKARFLEFMDDDFNSRGAIAAVFEFVREANRLISERKLSREGAKQAILFLEDVDRVFGILPPPPKADAGELAGVMQLMIELRQELRRRKMYDLADQIRDRLSALGIKLEDTAEGAKWKRL